MPPAERRFLEAHKRAVAEDRAARRGRLQARRARDAATLVLYGMPNRFCPGSIALAGFADTRIVFRRR
jgi:hypothetical protein